MTGLLSRLRSFYKTQLHLWDLYSSRHDLTGLEARAAMPLAALAPLHWAGMHLHGQVLPDWRECRRDR